MILTLSPLMQQAVGEWGRLGHKLDTKLLTECAYYPRRGCQHCSFDKPNLQCNRSHILTLTYQDKKFGSKSQCDFLSPLQPIKVKQEKRKREAWGVSLESIWHLLPESVREEIDGRLKEVRDNEI